MTAVEVDSEEDRDADPLLSSQHDGSGPRPGIEEADDTREMRSRHVSKYDTRFDDDFDDEKESKRKLDQRREEARRNMDRRRQQQRWRDDYDWPQYEAPEEPFTWSDAW